jgi:imidazoleglycerol-phosphate dehydratase
MRKAEVARKTRETEVSVELNLDGEGEVEISTGIPFFDHMLTLLGYHACFDLRLKAAGDLDVDQHHTVEDVGLCLGQALRKALGEKKGIKRFGWSLAPMDESLSQVSLDCSGRPLLSYRVELPVEMIGGFDPLCTREFLQSLVNAAGLTLHVRKLEGDNPHHILESLFKGVGLALRDALALDNRRKGSPSSKGSLD